MFSARRGSASPPGKYCAVVLINGVPDEPDVLDDNGTIEVDPRTWRTRSAVDDAERGIEARDQFAERRSGGRSAFRGGEVHPFAVPFAES